VRCGWGLLCRHLDQSMHSFRRLENPVVSAAAKGFSILGSDSPIPMFIFTERFVRGTQTLRVYVPNESSPTARTWRVKAKRRKRIEEMRKNIL
jgi:hypothetical protein